MGITEIITATTHALNFADKLMDKLPDYAQRRKKELNSLRKDYVTTKNIYLKEKKKEVKDLRALVRFRNDVKDKQKQVDIFLNIFWKEINK